MLNDKLYVLWWRMCNPYDIANYGVSRQPPDHTAQTRSHGTNQVTRDKSGTKRDLQAPHGGPGYGVTVQMSLWWLASVKDSPKNLPFKFSWNWVKNSWDIPDIDICRQDKCCLDKCHRDGWDLLKMVPQTYL